jgi:hypothetical protein
MRKFWLFLALIALVSGSCFAAGIVTSLSVDLEGKMIMADNENNARTIEPGLAVAADLIFTSTPNAELGLGVEYQKERLWDDQRTFQFVPIYGFLNLHGDSRSWTREVQPYFTGRFGYSRFIGPNSKESYITAEDGLYYKAGLGINFQNKIRLEANYSSCLGQEHGYVLGTNYEYTRTAITLSAVF